MAIAAAFPQAPVWALAGRRSVAERMGLSDRFHLVLPERDLLLRHYRLLAPLYPAVVRLRRLPEADLLVTSSYAFSHGFRTLNDATQVCYCYSPLRFAWSMTNDYATHVAGGTFSSRSFRLFAGGMRYADRRAASRVTHYVADSHHVARQIRQAYGRGAEVLHPPVDCDLFRPPEVAGHDGYYLFCGRLVEPYKRPGMTVEAFRSLPDKRLVVAGDGPAYLELKQRAPANVEFLGEVRDGDLVGLLQRCAATVFPSVDDFGLTAVETMACGRPVLAYAGGGALETVVPSQTGEFFNEASAPALTAALKRFDPDAYDPAAIRVHAERWGVPRFRDALTRTVGEVAARG